MTIKSVKLRVSVHATEEEDRVIKALLNALPEELRSSVKISQDEYEGHYGNPIKVITITIHGENAETVISYILSKLSSIDKQLLAASLEDRVDKEGNLYFRISKQDAFRGKLVVYESDDVIKITINFKGKRKEAMSEYKRRLEA